MATLQEDGSEISTVDRFSNLPNETAHHFLSFLSYKDATRVGCVSKRCRGLHLSSPSVNFFDFSDVNNLPSCEVRKSLLHSFDRCLKQHRDSRIRCFRFTWCAHFLDLFDEDAFCYCDEGNLHLCSWIDNAVTCSVELVYVSPDWFECLPSSLFHCESLRSLTLDIKGFIGEVTSSLSSLEHLKLSRVIVKEGFWKWVSDSCQRIKKIHLGKVSGSEDVIIDFCSKT